MSEDFTQPELMVEAVTRIASRMRFEDPARFIEFFDKQLSKHIVGLPHPEPLPPGTEMLVIVSPPGAPDALQMNGRVTKTTPRADSTFRLRVEVTPTFEDMTWLDAYIVGLRVAVDWHQEALESIETPSLQLPEEDDLLVIAGKLDTMSYYELLEVEPDVHPDVLQLQFHTLTRRFHPDLYLASDDPDLLRAVNRIYRRMNEAYAVLKSPRRRRAYDDGLEGAPHTWSLRLTGEAAERARRLERVQRGETGTGDFYWEKARALLDVEPGTGSRAEGIAEAVRLLRLAVTFEPDNEHFRRLLAEFDHGATPAPSPSRKRKTAQNRSR